MSLAQVSLISLLLDSVDPPNREIASIDKQIQALISVRQEDLKFDISVPGMGFISASTILAEIGNFKDFRTEDKLAAYCGLVPSIYHRPEN